MDEKEIKKCCLCENNHIRSIRQIVENKIINKYYCKTHDPLKNAKWTTNIGKEIIREIKINKQNKCDNRFL